MNKELVSILKNFNGFNSEMLYDDLIVIKKATNFNNLELTKFLVAYSLLSKSIISSEQIIEYWSKLDRVDPNKITKLNNSLDNINPDWVGVIVPNSNSEKESSNSKTKSLKIYLSIDNNSLHLFANKFLLSCLDRDYTDFDFKINKNPNINRRDNVVIYCNEENFGKYVSLIQEIVQNNLEIKFNQPHLLGIPYDEHIRCGIDFDDGKTSYADKICESIFNGLQNGKTPEEIVRLIENFKEQKASAITSIVNMTNSNSKH